MRGMPPASFESRNLRQQAIPEPNPPDTDSASGASWQPRRLLTAPHVRLVKAFLPPRTWAAHTRTTPPSARASRTSKVLTLFHGLAGSARAAGGGAARVDHRGGSGARSDPGRPVPTDRPPGATARHTAAGADPAELRADRRRPAPGGRRRPGCRLLDRRRRTGPGMSPAARRLRRPPRTRSPGRTWRCCARSTSTAASRLPDESCGWPCPRPPGGSPGRTGWSASRCWCPAPDVRLSPPAGHPVRLRHPAAGHLRMRPDPQGGRRPYGRHPPLSPPFPGPVVPPAQTQPHVRSGRESTDRQQRPLRH